MHRTQISLDEPLYEALRKRAFERRISMSQVVREALSDYLADAPTPDTGSGTGPGSDASGTDRAEPHT